MLRPETIVMAICELERTKCRLLGKPEKPYPEWLTIENHLIAIDEAAEDLKRALHNGRSSG